jgi:hypothetical protein
VAGEIIEYIESHAVDLDHPPVKAPKPRQPAKRGKKGSAKAGAKGSAGKTVKGPAGKTAKGAAGKTPKGAAGEPDIADDEQE